LLFIISKCNQCTVIQAKDATRAEDGGPISLEHQSEALLHCFAVNSSGFRGHQEAGTAKNWQTRIFGEMGVAKRQATEKKHGAPLGQDALGVAAIRAQTSQVMLDVVIGAGAH
jgi:hypothetical protein